MTEARALAEPMLPVKVDGKVLSMLVDSGATHSTITGTVDTALLFSTTLSLTGFSGKAEILPFTKPLTTEVRGKRLSYSFISAYNSPVHLFG